MAEQVPAIPLTQDQILAQLQVRGFEQGFQRTPLRDFWGRLTSITGEMRQGNQGSFAVALYNFDQIEVLPGGSTEPYNSPVGQIEVSVSVKEKSKMGYLGKSIDRIINAGIPLDAPAEQTKNQGYIIGKFLRMKLTPGHMIPNKDDATGVWGEKPTDCWELMEIRGETSAPASTPVYTPAGVAPAQAKRPVDANAQALALLAGKTEQQWHQAVFIDPIIKANTGVIQTIINRSFLNGLEAAGKVVKDANGVYTVIP